MSTRVGTCPHCAKQMQPTLIEKNIIRRNRYECTKCFKKIVECIASGCHNYVVLGFWNRYCLSCACIDDGVDDYNYTEYPSSNKNIENAAKLGGYYAVCTTTAKAVETKRCAGDDSDTDSCDVDNDSTSVDCDGDSGGDD